jgi:hypothetical protein
MPQVINVNQANIQKKTHPAEGLFSRHELWVFE